MADKVTKGLRWREHIKLDKPIIFNNDFDHPKVTCVNCDLVIGHPSIFYDTKYECPRCGYKYK